MAISTTSVIHYTDRIANLKSILTSQAFKLKYCCEELDISLDTPLSSAIPMVSFCDIPLSEIKNHIDSYGSYGIGLTKSWAKKSGLNPVLYLEKESKLSTLLRNQVDRIMESLEREEKGENIDEGTQSLKSDFLKLISYCKNYEGALIRGKVNEESYRFYDEREWRYVPTKEDLGKASYIIHADKYKPEKTKYNNTLKNIQLSFAFSDITYLIVDNENDIPEILTTLNNVYEDKCTTKELKILSTKIITKNQIFNDI